VQEAFKELKSIVSLAPVLAYFDYSKTAYLEANSSDYVQGSCLSQIVDKILHLVAFFFQKLTLAKCNYKIYNKELLAIVNCLEQ
jgi:hypothetical protein